jgi:hypothetical protein
MTKRPNKGSQNQNAPQRGNTEFSKELTSGDNSKGNMNNKEKYSKTK